jgi:protein tyrosine/serine phosphatase
MRRAWLYGCAGLVLLAFSAAGGYAADIVLNNNFNEVRPGELYRSAQPDALEIAAYANRYKIKTIVNLRGSNPGTLWYDSEVAASEALGITHIDFPMSAKRELTLAQAQALVEIFRTAEKPILIHCEAGADRSGLASALYLAAVSKVGEATAERQLSIRFGHISSPLSASYAMDLTFENLEPWLGFKDS